jgi:hypothetical protein
MPSGTSLPYLEGIVLMVVSADVEKSISLMLKSWEAPPVDADVHLRRSWQYSPGVHQRE